jgi:uncharacterized protein
MAKTASEQNTVTATGLAAAAQVVGAKGLPPVHLWNPPDCGDIDIRIARDGTWWHEGSPINRAPMVRLFSTILRRDGDRYVLVTPVEKVGITVEDVPFIAVDFTVAGTGVAQVLTFTTNLGDMVSAGRDAPLRMDGSAPYVMVRAGLEARLDRKSYYRLAELGCIELVDGDAWFGVWSGGVFWPMQRENELE